MAFRMSITSSEEKKIGSMFSLSYLSLLTDASIHAQSLFTLACFCLNCDTWKLNVGIEMVAPDEYLNSSIPTENGRHFIFHSTESSIRPRKRSTNARTNNRSLPIFKMHTPRPTQKSINKIGLSRFRLTKRESEREQIFFRWLYGILSSRHHSSHTAKWLQAHISSFGGQRSLLACVRTVCAIPRPECRHRWSWVQKCQNVIKLQIALQHSSQFEF